MKDIFVIVCSSGEYSDRVETLIRYVLTEEDAQAAVARAERETREGLRPPYPKSPRTCAWQLPNGEYLPDSATGVWRDAKWVRLPGADEMDAEHSAAVEAWQSECEALGLVDPPGLGECYYYARVSLWEPDNFKEHGTNARP